jgi:hypothetical protein
MGILDNPPGLAVGAAIMINFVQPAALPALVRGLAARGIIGLDLWEWAMAKGGPDARPGEKRQAIRPRRSGAPAPAGLDGAPLELWWKAPSPCRRLLARVGCRALSPVTLTRQPEGGPPRAVIGDGVEVDAAELAMLDGFASVGDLEAAFVPNPGDTFEGWLIRW